MSHPLINQRTAVQLLQGAFNTVVETQQPLPLAPYSSNRVAGALIVVDPTTHRTSGALLVSD